MAVIDRTGQLYRRRPKKGDDGIRIIRITGKNHNESARKGHLIWDVEVIEGVNRNTPVSSSSLEKYWSLHTEILSESVKNSVHQRQAYTLSKNQLAHFITPKGNS